MKFVYLFQKELKQEKAWFTYVLVIFLFIEIMLFLFSKQWPIRCTVLSFLFILALPFCVLWNILHSYAVEWERKTSQYLFSLPIRGWHIFSAKFAVNALILIFFSLIAFLGVYFLTKSVHWNDVLGFTANSGVFPDSSMKFDNSIKFNVNMDGKLPSFNIMQYWGTYLLFIIPAMSFHLLPYIASKCFVRFQKLITYTISIALIIVFFRYILPLGFKLFGSFAGPTGEEFSLFTPGLLIWILWGVVLFVSNCFILDKWAET